MLLKDRRWVIFKKFFFFFFYNLFHQTKITTGIASRIPPQVLQKMFSQKSFVHASFLENSSRECQGNSSKDFFRNSPQTFFSILVQRTLRDLTQILLKKLRNDYFRNFSKIYLAFFLCNSFENFFRNNLGKSRKVKKNTLRTNSFVHSSRDNFRNSFKYSIENLCRGAFVIFGIYQEIFVRFIR